MDREIIPSYFIFSCDEQKFSKHINRKIYLITLKFWIMIILSQHNKQTFYV